MSDRILWPLLAGAAAAATVSTAIAGDFSWWFALATLAFTARSLVTVRGKS